MPTLNADKALQHRRLLERNQIKRVLHVLSTAPVPEKKKSLVTKAQRPKYLRYIEYV